MVFLNEFVQTPGIQASRHPGICIISFLALFASQVSAQLVLLSNVTDPISNQRFSNLTQYRTAAQITQQELIDTGAAMDALINLFAPMIANLTNYTGVFSGNCSVFFEEWIESSECNLLAIAPENVTLVSQAGPSIVTSHIIGDTCFAVFFLNLI